MAMSAINGDQITRETFDMLINTSGDLDLVTMSRENSALGDLALNLLTQFAGSMIPFWYTDFLPISDNS